MLVFKSKRRSVASGLKYWAGQEDGRPKVRYLQVRQDTRGNAWNVVGWIRHIDGQVPRMLGT